MVLLKAVFLCLKMPFLTEKQNVEDSTHQISSKNKLEMSGEIFNYLVQLLYTLAIFVQFQCHKFSSKTLKNNNQGN
jgi:hypothetical protein